MRGFFGGLLLAIGILLMTGSGLCTGAVIVSMFGGGGGAGMVLLPLIVGGVPFAAGLGLFFAGRSMLRRPRVLDEDELTDRFR